MKNLPVSCTLGPEALKARREQLLPGLIARARERVELPEGLRVRLDGTDALVSIAHVIDVERQCCRFLQFNISVGADGGPVWLEITGPPGTREFLEALGTG